MKIHLEKWTSTEGRTETHWFDDNSDEYLFGYNEEVIPRELVEPIFQWLSKQ
jgi:hypothetical protein